MQYACGKKGLGTKRTARLACAQDHVPKESIYRVCVCECVRECVRECVMPSDNWLRKGERERTSQPAHMRYVDLARSIPTRSLSGK